MKTVRTFFSSFRNVMIFVVCAAVLAALGTGIALAAGTEKNGTIMNRSEALDHAFADAGVSSSDVTITKQKLEKENGRQYYDIEFFSGKYAYDYEIDAITGAVTGVNIEALFDRPSEPLAASGAAVAGDGRQDAGGTQQDAGGTRQDIGESRQEQDSQPDITQSPQPAQAGQESRIDLEAARTAALSDAGVDAADAVFTKSKLDWDDGVQVYEIEFHTLEAKYEYGVNAETGTIMSKEKEQLPGSQSGQPGTSQPQQPAQASQESRIDLEAARTAALSDAGVDAADAVFTKSKLDWDDGVQVYEIEFHTQEAKYEYEVNAETGTIMSKEKEQLSGDQSGRPGTSQQPAQGDTGNADSYIGMDQAKAAAVAHAGLDVSDVVFTKTKLEQEHGYAEYEIKFYRGRMEYEYTIDAFTGDILEHECEYDD